MSSGRGNGSQGVNPPAKSTPKVKVPVLDDITKSHAKKWGYSEEDLAQLYGE